MNKFGLFCFVCLSIFLLFLFVDVTICSFWKVLALCNNVFPAGKIESCEQALQLFVVRST